MEIRRYLSILRRRLPLALAVIIVALGAGWLVSPRHHTYTATSTLYVGSRSIDIDPTSGEVSGDRVAGLDRLITTFTALVPTGPIAAAAVDAAKVPRSASQVSAGTQAKQIPNTDLISVSYTDRNRAISQAVTNAVATALVNQIRAFEPASAGAADQVISVYQTAGLPGAPNPRGIVNHLVLAGLFGLLVAGALIALLEYLDITLRSADDAERQLELPVLGVVPALGAELPVPRAISSRTDLLPRPPLLAHGDGQ
jgi:capsular polysaccharide biosynthesis protein